MNPMKSKRLMRVLLALTTFMMKHHVAKLKTGWGVETRNGGKRHYFYMEIKKITEAKAIELAKDPSNQMKGVITEVDLDTGKETAFTADELGQPRDKRTNRAPADDLTDLGISDTDITTEGKDKKGGWSL